MRFLQIGARWFLDDLDHASLSFDDLMRLAGANSGNLFIGEALRRHLLRLSPAGSSVEYLTIPAMRQADPLELRERYDHIVMAASNMLDPNIDLGYVAKSLRAIGLPFSVIGIGAQAHTTDSPMTLPEGTRDLFRLVEETGGIAGVRGDYSLRVLEANDIRSAVATGCPTMYLNAGNPNFTVRPHAFPPQGRVIVSYKLDRNNYDNDPIVRELQRAMMQDQLAHGFHQIAQSNQLDGRDAYTRVLTTENFVGRRKYFQIPTEQKEAFRTLMHENSHLFFTWESWRRFVEPAAFAYGLRFHGNVMALMAGVPTLFITHDSRTEEMCKLASFPYATAEDLHKKGYSYERMVELADPGAFLGGYGEKCARFDAFLKRIIR